MHWRYILKTIGVLLLFFGLTMLVPLAYALFMRDPGSVPVLKAMGITLACGGLLAVTFRKSRAEIISQRHEVCSHSHLFQVLLQRAVFNDPSPGGHPRQNRWKDCPG